MPGIPHLPVFLLASLVLAIIPGPAVLYIVTRSVDQGRRAGLVSVCAIAVGTLAQILAASLGLSALLLSSALAFTLVKDLGAAYLIYLGLRKIFSREAVRATAENQAQRLRRIFFQGVVIQTLNPKTALFFIAFLPQFVDRSQGAITWQMLVLGCIFVLLAAISDSMYALLAGSVGRWFKTSRSAMSTGRYVAGGVYIGLGLTAALGNVQSK
ncbi:MAG: LysE family translocator [Syntrophobacteraceae bacterium]